MVRYNFNDELSDLKPSFPTTYFEYLGKSLAILGPINLPIKSGTRTEVFHWLPFIDLTESQHKSAFTDSSSVNSLLVFDNGSSKIKPPIVRIQSACVTGEIFRSQRCDCGVQLDESMSCILDEGYGVIAYLSSHEGRGIGLWAKAQSYLLQEAGHDTFSANSCLGFPDDLRDFTAAAAALKFILAEQKQIHLITNNPEKIRSLEACGIEVLKQISLPPRINQHNRAYLSSKARKGHSIEINYSNATGNESTTVVSG